jgi:hypothetical protein
VLDVAASCRELDTAVVLMIDNVAGVEFTGETGGKTPAGTPGHHAGG